MIGLTDRQAEILRFIAEVSRRDSFPPTFREIASHLGIRSTNAINDHLNAIERKGYLVRGLSQSRAIGLTALGQAFVDAPRPVARRPQCPHCNAAARAVYRCLGCERRGCSAACLACTCANLAEVAA